MPCCSFFEELFRWGAYNSIQRGVGLMAGLSAALVWVTSMNWVRRKYFEVRSHNGLGGLPNIHMACMDLGRACHVHYKTLTCKT